MKALHSLRFALGLAAAVALLTLAAPRTHAQCLGPDNMDFNGICCDVSQPNLPQFPAIKQNVQYICWRDCDVAKTRNLCVDLTVPTPHVFANGNTPGCAIFDIGVNLRTCGPAMQSVFAGRVIATYARTWFEDTDPANPGPETQVWRFLWNGDLAVTPFLNGQFGNNPCVPQCHHSFNNQVYWFGYIDYRLDCATNTWNVEWVLDHECDRYHHNADSARPAPAAGFHPNRSFTFVGPSLFTPSITIPVAVGPIMQENTRTLAFTGQNPVRCFRDDPIVQGGMDTMGDLCSCVPNGAAQYALTFMQGFTQCQTSFLTVTQTKDFVQKRLGFFTDAAGNPTKLVLLNMGDIEYFDACLGVATFEYFEGAATLFGPPAFTFDPAGALVPLFPQFVDTGSSNRVNGARVKGFPHFTSKLIDVNLP